VKIIEALKPLLIDIKSVKPDPRNARQHPSRNIDTIKKSLEAYGQRKPIVVNSNTGFIEAGNGMWEAAKSLGWTQIAVVKVDDDKDVAKAYGLMDNQSALLADWDLPTLKDLLQELDDGSVDMDLTGFNVDEIEELMTQFHEDNEGLTDDDAIPEDVETVCKSGDLWILGNHRLLCGDATKKEDVERLMGGEKADMVFTDPPYGIDVKGDRSKRHGITKGNKLQDFTDDTTKYAVDAFALCVSIPVQVWWGANYYANELPPSSNWLVWDKRENDIERDTQSDCELAWCKSRFNSVRIFRHLWKGLIKASEHGQRRVHPTQKPIALALWAIKELDAGNIILDLFGGSGSTLIACEKLDRKCYMMEIDKHYCDVIIKRWEDFTGKKAERERIIKIIADYEDEKLDTISMLKAIRGGE